MSMKIIWALDAFEESTEVLKNSARLLNTLARNGDAEIEPVYVLSPEQLGLNLEFAPTFTAAYVPAAEKALQQKIRWAEGPAAVKPARVLTHERSSLRGAAETVANYARGEGADLIVVGSHAKKGFNRWLLGSFAEELLLQAGVPVMLVGAASAQSGQEIQRVLFPTDFGRESEAAFNGALDLAARLGVPITLLHTIPRPIDPVIQSGVFMLSGGWVPFPDFQKHELTRQKDAANRFKALSASRGVKLESVFDTGADSIVDSILTNAENGPPALVAMAAQTGRWGVAILGSVTRKVARGATCPVWVYRPGK
jgi:nucleotide-binding universal stress UspA family protein